jgi:predicted RNA-binding protein YlqC (UPF0109 family)
LKKYNKRVFIPNLLFSDADDFGMMHSLRSGDLRQLRRTRIIAAHDFCMEFDQQFVEFIVKALVNHPDQVTSERKVDEQGVLITVHTSPEDTGYVIGKSGKTAVAIRTLLATIGAKANMRVSFRIDAPASSMRRSQNEEGVAAGALADAPMDDVAVDSLTF